MAKLLIWYNFDSNKFLFNITSPHWSEHNLGFVNQFDYVLIKKIEPKIKKRFWKGL